MIVHLNRHFAQQILGANSHRLVAHQDILQRLGRAFAEPEAVIAEVDAGVDTLFAQQLQQRDVVVCHDREHHAARATRPQQRHHPLRAGRVGRGVDDHDLRMACVEFIGDANRDAGDLNVVAGEGQRAPASARDPLVVRDDMGLTHRRSRLRPRVDATPKPGHTQTLQRPIASRAPAELSLEANHG